jgi:hypothetical protein
VYRVSFPEDAEKELSDSNFVEIICDKNKAGKTSWVLRKHSPKSFEVMEEIVDAIKAEQLLISA